MRLLKFKLVIAVVALILGCQTSRSDDPGKIRMAWVAPISGWGSILLEKKDLARHLGKSYVLEAVMLARRR